MSCCMSRHHVHAACPSWMSMLCSCWMIKSALRVISLLHVHAACLLKWKSACPCWMSLLHTYVECPYSIKCPCRISICSHVHAAWLCCMSMLHVHAACPCRMSKLHVLAACPCCRYMLHVNAACTYVLHVYPNADVHAACYIHAACHVHAVCPCCMHMLHLLLVSQRKLSWIKRTKWTVRNFRLIPSLLYNIPVHMYLQYVHTWTECGKSKSGSIRIIVGIVNSRFN
jgi:hypothetical protein